MKKELIKFSKQQLIEANAYRGYRDFLSGVLEENKMYSHDEVSAIIRNFYGKDKVK